MRELVVDSLREWAEASHLPHAAPLAAVARVALQLIRDPISKGPKFNMLFNNTDKLDYYELLLQISTFLTDIFN